MVYYITDCGCEVDESGLKRFNYVGKNGKRTYRMACKEHEGFVVSRRTYCSICDDPEPMEFGLRGQCSDKCPEHTANTHRARMRATKRSQGNPTFGAIDKYPRIDKYIPEASVWAFNACYGKGITGTKDDIEKTQEWSDYFLRAMDRILSLKGLRVL